MRRTDLAALIASATRDEDLVVCSLGSGGRAWRQSGSAALTYFASDPMGLAPSLALGLALAQPGRNVWLIEGDGDLSMGLTALLAIASAAPPNLRIVVFQNGRYETGGGQPLGSAQTLSFATLAAGAGLRWSRDILAASEAAGAVEELRAQPGPSLLAVVVEAEASPYPSAGTWSQAEERTLFMHRLAQQTPASAT